MDPDRRPRSLYEITHEDKDPKAETVERKNPYTGKSSILLTGATGFLGKVVLEELFRRQDELEFEKVFIVIRSKRGHDARGRFLRLATSPCFSLLASTWMDSVQVIEGDLTQDICGIEKRVYEKLCSELTTIIHCAGCVRFDLPIKEAALQNVGGALNILGLARSCKYLQGIVVTSTAYVSTKTLEPIYEELAPLPLPADQLRLMIKSETMKEKDILHLTGHPNTYTLTKSIAEHLLLECGEDAPIRIVRPSIITASKQYPFPGWIDSYATLAGIIAAMTTGKLRVLDSNPKTILDVVAVDEVARHLINDAFISTRGKKIRFSVATLKHGLELESASQEAVEFFQSMLDRRQARICRFRPRDLRFHCQDFLYHKLALSIASLYFGLRRNKKMRREVKNMAKTLTQINNIFPYFVHNSFDFRPIESPLDGMDKKEFVKLFVQGIERHLLSQKGACK
ncbi:male sterility protein-domain-containing protein [Bisporella sp. PMI_857]|nr:male sterility protein-domain-containing protein [Bisporella sp. PMI_857]